MAIRLPLVALSAMLVSSILHGQSLFSIGVGQVTLPDTTVVTGGTLPSSYIVSFPANSFDSTPAVFILPDTVNPDPATLRVHTVTQSGFEVFVAESEGEDGTTYPTQPFEYLAIEPGSYSIGGTTIYVDVEPGVTAFRSKLYGGDSWNTVTYPSPFTGSAPSVLAQLQTLNNDASLLSGPGSTFNRTTEPWLEVAMDTAGLASIDMALERAENPSPVPPPNPSGEDIAWMAVATSGAAGEETFLDDALNSVELKAFLSADNITGNCVTTNLSSDGLSDFGGSDPIYFSSQITWDGGDGGWVRRCSDNISSVTVEIEEDLATDTDQTHTTEQVAFVAFSEEFQTTDDDTDGLNFNMLVGSDSIPARSATPTYSLNPTSVLFSSEFGANFSATPVVVPMSTSEGNGDPAMVRVWGISSSGFSIAATVPEGTTIPADGMTVDFLAVVPGSHVLPDGTEVRAGIGSTTNCIGGISSCAGAYTNVSFGFTEVPTPTDPIVLAAAQSIANDSGFDPENPADPFLSTSIINKTSSSFDFSFELAQTNQGSPLAFPETFGWIAMEGGLSGDLRAAEGTTGTGNHLIEFRTLNTAPVSIFGWDDSPPPACYNFSFPSAFTAAVSPLTIATHTTRFGGDGGWIRKCSATGSLVSLVFDEDLFSDTERSHGNAEQGAIAAFSDTFAWGPLLYRHSKTGFTEWDPVSLFAVERKAIPESWTRYTVVVENLDRIGANNNSLEIVDSVPSNTTLFVGDLDAGCPIDWTDDADPSGLSFVCATDLLLYDGGACVPADSDGFCPYSSFSFGSDWDATITSIKVAPTGEFLGSNGSTLPDFEFDFRVRID